MKYQRIPPQTKICAYYDLKASPITFDFVHFLAAAVAYSRAWKLNQIDLVIVADSWRMLTPRERHYTDAERDWRLWNLLAQVVQICPNIRTFSICRSPLITVNADCFPENYNPRSNYIIPYTPKYVRQFFDVGIDVRCFRATKKSKEIGRRLFRDSRNIVTMSPRVAGFDETRDSILPNWFDAYEQLVAQGNEVVVIPDQDDVLGNRRYETYPWRTVPEAAMNLDLKLGLYELAAANVISSGGNIGPVIYSNARFAIVKTVVEESPVASSKFHDAQGFPQGTQYPWFSESQRFTWGGDSAAELVACVSSQLNCRDADSQSDSGTTPSGVQ